MFPMVARGPFFAVSGKIGEPPEPSVMVGSGEVVCGADGKLVGASRT